MSCSDFDTILDRVAEDALSPEAAAHVESCGRCRRLWGALRAVPGTVTDVPEGIQQRIAAYLNARLKPVSPMPARAVTVAALLGAFAVVLLAFVLLGGGRALTAMSATQVIALGAVTLAAAWAAALSASREIVPGEAAPPRRLMPALAAALLLSALALFPWHPEKRFVDHGVRCLLSALTIALPAAGLFWLVLRRGYALAPGRLGAILGLLAGLSGFMIVQSSCPLLEAAHISVWHAGALGVGAFAGFAGGHCWAWRRNRQ